MGYEAVMESFVDRMVGELASHCRAVHEVYVDDDLPSIDFSNLSELLFS
jgi:hypothetical protein